MATYNVKSTGQSGGVTAGKIGGPGNEPPRTRHPWRWLGGLLALIAAAGAIAEILGYLNIRP